MKISKSLLQTIALAVAVTTTVSTASSCKEAVVKPKKDDSKRVPYNCPACGMG